MSAPVFSIVIPTFNRAGLLKRAIRSALCQSGAAYEVIVMDDASTDCTEETVRAIDDARLKYGRLATNRGSSATRNAGVALAAGCWISFLDDDDELEPTFLYHMSRALAKAGPETGYAWCAVKYMSNTHQGAVAKVKHWSPLPGWRTDPVERWINVQKVGTNFGFTVRRELLQSIGGFDEQLRAFVDTDLLLRLAEAADGIAISTPLVRIYQHSGAMLTRPSLQRAEAFKYIRDKYRRKYDKYRVVRGHFAYRLAAQYYHADHCFKALQHLLAALRIQPLSLATWRLALYACARCLFPWHRHGRNVTVRTGGCSTEASATPTAASLRKSG